MWHWWKWVGVNCEEARMVCAGSAYTKGCCGPYLLVQSSSGITSSLRQCPPELCLISFTFGPLLSPSTFRPFILTIKLISELAWGVSYFKVLHATSKISIMWQCRVNISINAWIKLQQFTGKKCSFDSTDCHTRWWVIISNKNSAYTNDCRCKNYVFSKM